ncbi:MAG: hypothetical protein ABI550_08830 [Ignavibacteriaceae bacterium]
MDIKPSMSYDYLPIVSLKIRDAIPKNSVVFLEHRSDSAINWRDSGITDKDMDSIMKLTEFSLSGLSYFCTLKLEFQNIGDMPLQMVQVFIGANLESTPYWLRDVYYGNNPPEDHLNFTTDEHRTFLKDSIIHLAISQFPLFLPVDSVTNKAVLHILVLYRDIENNYYDSYYWATYKFKDPIFTVKPYLNMKWDSLGNVRMLPIVVVSRDLETSDFIEFISSTYEYGHPLTEIQKQKVISYLLKIRKIN